MTTDDESSVLPGVSARRWFFWVEAVGLAWFLYLAAIAVVYLTPLAPEFQAPAHPLRLWALLTPFFVLCVWPILGQRALSRMSRELRSGYTTVEWILAAPLRDAKTGVVLREKSPYNQTFSLRAARVISFAPAVGAAAALVTLGLLAVRIALTFANH